jgi:hypothetical protein
MIVEGTPAMAQRYRNIMQQRKQLILNFVHLFREQHQGISPSVKQIAHGIGYGKKSSGSTASLVNELIAEGWLYREVPGSRTLVLSHPPETIYHEISDPDLQELARKQKRIANRKK